MSERRYQARPPLRDDVDLSSDSWKFQKRDSHGRWTRQGAGAVQREKALEQFFAPKPPRFQVMKSAPAPKMSPAEKWANDPAAQATLSAIHGSEGRAFKVIRAKKVVQESRKVLFTKHGKVKDEPAAYRHFRKVTEEAQMAVFHEAGLDLKFEHHSTVELMTMWSQPGHSFEERQAWREEIDKRMKQLDVVAKAMDQSMTDFVRESHRDALRKFDQKLRTLPGGKAIIDLRERLISDHVLDHFEAVREHFHEHGKAYAKHVLTAAAVAAVLHPLGIIGLGGLAAAHLAPAGSGEVFTHLMENMWVHSGIAVALDVPLLKFLDPIFRPLEREARVRHAQKFQEKHKTRRLHV